MLLTFIPFTIIRDPTVLRGAFTGSYQGLILNQNDGILTLLMLDLLPAWTLLGNRLKTLYTLYTSWLSLDFNLVMHSFSCT